MAKFSQPFLEWIDNPDNGFFVSATWNVEDEVMEGTGKLRLFPHQRRILEHVLTQNAKGEFPYQTVVWSEPKKSGKTACAAAVAAWVGECAPDNTEIVIAANSAEQSEKRIFNDIAFHFKQNDSVKVNKTDIPLENGTLIYTISKNFTTVAGSRHAFSLFDEVWGATSESDHRRWDELTPIPTIPHSLRWVSSYAGFLGESMLLYELYLRGVGAEEHPDGKGQPIPGLEDLPCWSNGDLFVYWSHESRVPWITDKYLASQRASERPNAYLRLHENRWVTANEQFIPPEWWKKAELAFPQSSDLWKEHPYRLQGVYVGVDTAIKHDCTAIVGVTPVPEEGKVAVLFHKIWTPVKDEPLDLVDTVEKYLLEQSHKYHLYDIACDPSQMLQTMTKLKGLGLPISEYVQAENNMIEASQCLFDLLHDGNLWGYPSEEIAEHLNNCIAQMTTRGFRIVKDKSTKQRALKKKIDAAIAMAMACAKAVKNMDADAGKIIYIRSEFGDFTSLNGYMSEAEAKLPFPFRN